MSEIDMVSQVQMCFDRVATEAQREEIAMLFLHSDFMAGATRMSEILAPHDAELAAAYLSTAKTHPTTASAAELFAGVSDRSMAEAFLVSFGSQVSGYGPAAITILSTCSRLSTVLRHDKLRFLTHGVPEDVVRALADMLDRFEISGPDCLRAAGIDPVSTVPV